MTITHPGIYNIPAEQYHQDPCPEPSLSCSIAKLLLTHSPRHAWANHPRLNSDFVSEEKGAFDLGKAAHSLMLNDPQRFAVIDAPDWRTKAAKAARDRARNEGKIPMLAGRWPEVRAMVEAGRAQIAAHEDAPLAFVPGTGTPEATLIWEEDGLWFRCRLDWLPKQGATFYDYKSTGLCANPDTWERQFYALGYDIQSAFYRRGIRRVLEIDDPAFEFVVHETEYPYALSVIGVPPSTVDMADRKVDEAIRWWGWCLKNNMWPGYPKRTCFISMPVYVEQQWLQREARDDLTREGDREALFKLAIDWQAPHKPGVSA